MKLVVRNALISASVMAVLVFLLFKTKLAASEDHNRFVNLILRAQALGSSLNENLLRARNAYLINYDPIVKELQGLQAISVDLAMIPGFLGHGDVRRQLEQDVRDYAVLIARKDVLVERFKSENSILHNSLSFFPVAAVELARSDTTVGPLVQTLLRDILMYNLHSNDESLPRIRDEIATLSAFQGQMGNSARANGLKRVLDHGNAILKYKADLDTITFEALNLPTVAKLRTIQVSYGDQYRRTVTTSNNYRLVLYLYSILLTAALAYYFLWLKKTAQALHDANQTLETRVLERTKELNKANGDLTVQKEQLEQYLTDLRAAQERLQRISITDELTGLYTRRFLFEWMEKYVGAMGRHSGKLSCLLLDVDLFKQVNDTFGHGAGDDVLRHVAETIRTSVRQSDIVGRYGGEEFLLLLPDTALGDAAGVAEKVRAAIEKAVTHPRQVTATLGVASLQSDLISTSRPDASRIIATLLEVADQALYRGKESGRNRVESSSRFIEM